METFPDVRITAARKWELIGFGADCARFLTSAVQTRRDGREASTGTRTDVGLQEHPCKQEQESAEEPGRN